MLNHLFKLIWNRRKKNVLLILEILFSFFVMFAVFTFAVYYFQNYRLPYGFDYERVWTVNYPPGDINQADSLRSFRESVNKLIISMPQVERAGFTSNNTPFGPVGFAYGSEVSYQGKTFRPDRYMADENYANVLGVTMTEGRWLSKSDSAAKEPAAVINVALRVKLFGSENALGKLISVNGRNMRISGVANDLKDKADFIRPGMAIYLPYRDSGSNTASSILIKVRQGAGATFESSLYKTLSRSLANGNVNIEHLDQKKKLSNNIALVPLLILIIIACFFIINAGLGFFGVLWYNIVIRREEIGLRRALGATGNAVSKQMAGEALMLSSLALVLGTFLVIQFPLLNVFDLPASTYLISLILSVLFIYTLTLLCAFYPAKLSANIYPADALREE